ncbi:glycosyltransferase family 4 protein [Bacteroides togonis]|uniref:glycosyltransferase family 4 protein n=1 Tax=Bacteroides togonis TaxID=1917883 RepID=UPI00094B5EE1|nr:glycosyltransferase family 1 protein [Bacteroides togonis]
MKIKIRRLIIDVLAFEYGKSFGYQEYIFNLLDYIYGHRNNIYYENIFIVCLEHQEKYFLKYEDKFLIKSYKCSSIWKRFLIQSYVPFDLRVTKQDLILYTANYTSLFKKASYILVIHDLLFKRKKLFPYTLMRLQRQFYLPISVNLANKIIAISKFTADDIVYFYRNSRVKIDVIYNYFNFKKYPELHNILKENCFISVCSAAYHKNTITVLKAFDKYNLKGGEYKLVLVGALKQKSESYLYYNQMSDMVKERIIIYDKIDNNLLALLYAQSKAYISASLFEGLGMPIVEAMYFNLPVILSDYPVFREVSLNKGIYFNPLDVDDLVDKMFLIQHNQAFSSNYRNEILVMYSENNTSQKYIDLFNEIYNQTK